MSVTKLPSGRWRAQVYDPRMKTNVSAAKILGVNPPTFASKREAKEAREAARTILYGRDPEVAQPLTVAQWIQRWTDDALYHVTSQGRQLKESTLHTRAEHVKKFVELFGELPLERVDDQVVAQFLAGGRRNYMIGDLRKCFADATSRKAGRLIIENPFAELGISRGRGNRGKPPPSLEEFETLIRIAWNITPPSFAAHLEMGCYTAMRPGELDALRHTDIDLEAEEIHVRRQWNARVAKYTDPKYGPAVIALTAPARELLPRIPRGVSGLVFESLRGTHYTPSSRIHHWNRVRSAAGLSGTTYYMATRHYFGWFALNVLDLEPSVIATQLGHKDGGLLVEQLYGHREDARSRAKIRDAFHGRRAVRRLRAVDGDSA